MPVPEVKICGVCRVEDAQLCSVAGADAIGINLHPGSKRYLEWAAAQPLLEEMNGRLRRVAVVVNLALAEIEKIWASGLLEEVQLHGDESADFCCTLLEQGIVVSKAVPVISEATIDLLAGYPEQMAFLLDAHVPGQRGGTGRVADWQLARQVVATLAHSRVLLSGGLTPDNVATAVQQVRPAGVDVASGVESSPGVKDESLVRAFVERVKSAGNNITA